MKVLFTILTIAGWTWTGFCAVMLIIHLRRARQMSTPVEPVPEPQTRGFEVIPRQTPSHEQTAR
jgi:hypothetical protein